MLPSHHGIYRCSLSTLSVSSFKISVLTHLHFPSLCPMLGSQQETGRSSELGDPMELGSVPLASCSSVLVWWATQPSSSSFLAPVVCVALHSGWASVLPCPWLLLLAWPHCHSKPWSSRKHLSLLGFILCSLLPVGSGTIPWPGAFVLHNPGLPLLRPGSEYVEPASLPSLTPNMAGLGIHSLSMLQAVSSLPKWRLRYNVTTLPPQLLQPVFTSSVRRFGLEAGDLMML